MHVLHQVLREVGVELQTEPLVFLEAVLVNETGEEHCCEERAEDTNDPRGGEALDRTCTEVEQNDTGDDRSEVRVEDSREGIAIACFQCVLDALASAHFFLDTLIDEHVGIDSRTQRKHDTGETRHGERSLERREDSEREEQVDDEGAVGHHTRDEAVHHDHVDHQEHEGHDERNDTLLDRLCTEGRTNHLFLNDAGGCRHTS